MVHRMISVTLATIFCIAGRSITTFTQTHAYKDSIMHYIHSKTIVFITGAFVSNSCWDEWRAYFESKGYSTAAPPWPFKNATAAELRARQPNDTDLAGLTMEELIDYYATIIQQCPEKPIVIGHSLGGLLTQIMVNKDLVAAGIAIHPAPPKGVLPYELTSIRSLIQAFGYLLLLKKPT